MIKPTHDPQVKNGEQPEQGVLFTGSLLANSLFSIFFSRQSLSEQHGLIESMMTYIDNSRQKNFTQQIYLFL